MNMLKKSVLLGAQKMNKHFAYQGDKLMCELENIELENEINKPCTRVPLSSLPVNTMAPPELTYNGLPAQRVKYWRYKNSYNPPKPKATFDPKRHTPQKNKL